MLGPARIVARILTVVIRLSRVARTATEFTRVVVAITTAIVRQPQVVIAIEVVRTVVPRGKTFFIPRVVVARIEIHTHLPAQRTGTRVGRRFRCDRFVTDVRGFGWAAVAAHRQKHQ